MTFPHGRDRNIALGVWGALAGLGDTLGVVAGGILVDGIGWEWVFFVNVPIGAALVAVAPALVSESRLPRSGSRDLDAVGALLGTAGLLAIVFGVVRAEPLGWGAPEVVTCLAAGAALLSAFTLVERPATSPLVSLRLFRARALRTASGALALNGATFLGMFFLTAIFLQEVRGESALSTGIELLPMGVAAVLAAVVVSPLATRLGTRPIQLSGAVLSVAGLWLLSHADAGSSYAGHLLPAFVLFGFGLIAVGVPAQTAAVADVRHDEAGAASELVTAGFQVGGALGIAIITTLANTRVGDALAAGMPRDDALVSGFHQGLMWATIFSSL